MFEAADDLELARSLGDTPPDVVEGGLVGPYANNDHAVEGGVVVPPAVV